MKPRALRPHPRQHQVRTILSPKPRAFHTDESSSNPWFDSLHLSQETLWKQWSETLEGTNANHNLPYRQHKSATPSQRATFTPNSQNHISSYFVMFGSFEWKKVFRLVFRGVVPSFGNKNKTALLCVRGRLSQEAGGARALSSHPVGVFAGARGLQS